MALRGPAYLAGQFARSAGRRPNLDGQSSVVSSEAAPPDGQAGTGVNAFAPPQAGGSQSGSGSAHRVGIGVNVSILLGIGVQGAVELTPKSNLRGGFNFFNYSTTENTSGFSVDASFVWRGALRRFSKRRHPDRY